MIIKRCFLLCLWAFQSYAQVSDFEGINFRKADSIALAYKNETLHNLPELAYKLTSNLPTEVEQFRAIFTWVCGNIANDYALYSRNMHKRQRFKSDSLKLENWNSYFRTLVYEKLLKRNKTICTGYAYLLEELAQLANIDCKMIHGFAKTSTIDIEKLDMPNHSWNVVKLQGKWYLCDPTWASGIPNPETFQFQFHYNDGFFLPNPKLFAINHYPVHKKWLLLENKPSFQMFLDAPIIYGEAYTNLNIHNEPLKMHNIIRKNDTVLFKYELLKPIKREAISLLIDNGSGSYKIYPKSISNEGRFLTVAYAFKRTGFYDVHFYIEDALISTYTVKVKKAGS